MSKRFYCDNCACSWSAKPGFWSGYQSPCPQCGTYCGSESDWWQRDNDKEQGRLLEFFAEEEQEQADEETADAEAEAAGEK